MNTSFVELASNDVVCLQAVEINSIPDLSITIYKSEEEARKAHNDLIKRALGEAYQVYKSELSNDGTSDIAIELLWVTQPVKNQTYAAQVKMFILFRCVCSAWIGSLPAPWNRPSGGCEDDARCHERLRTIANRTAGFCVLPQW